MHLEALAQAVADGRIDTVMVGFPDPFGRLVGKRFRAGFFLDSVVSHGTHGCNYLLTVNMDMDPLDGFQVANWDAGFGDFIMRPDLSTLREIPWHPGTALVLCDYVREDGSLVAEAPRSVLRRQLDRLKALGWHCECASELEFYLFNQTYHEAFAAGYRDLRPSSDYRIDYHLMQPGRDEPLMRAIRNQMASARVPVESSKGEWSRGQHEINFTHDEPLAMSDMHVLFKQGVRELASQHGKAVTFMAKYAPSEAGNSCHLHMSLWKDGRPAFWDESTKAGSPLFRSFLGGLLRYCPELCLLFAPTINSYKRYEDGSWAPTRIAWSYDNRTAGFRVVGAGSSLRIECRIPGADCNPYLAFAAALASGLDGIEQRTEPSPIFQGDVYQARALPRVPYTLGAATDGFAHSAFAAAAFGADVVEHYAHAARVEQSQFDAVVTDWERKRYFERI